MIPDDGIIGPIAVEIAASAVRLTRPERREAAARILASGDTAWAIAKRLHMNYLAARVLAASIAETEGLE